MKKLYLNDVYSALKGNKGYKSLLTRMNHGDFPVKFDGIRDFFLATLISKFKEYSGSMLIITPTEESARALAADLSFFDLNVVEFPWWGRMLYKGVSSRSDVFGTRARTLAKLRRESNLVCIAPLRAALSLLPEVESVSEELLNFVVGDVIDPSGLPEKMGRLGYYRVPRVTVPGEFALRGEVLDIFPAGEELAFRVVFSFDEVEKIKFFDPITQASSHTAEEVSVYPLKEVIWSDERIGMLEAGLIGLGIEPEGIIDELSIQRTISAEELYFPVAFDKQTLLPDFFDSNDLMFFLDYGNLKNYEKTIIEEHEVLYSRYDGPFPVPEPLMVSASLEELETRLKRKFYSDNFSGSDNTIEYDPEEIVDFVSFEQARSFMGNITFLKEELDKFVERKFKIFIFSESENQASRIRQLLKDYEIEVIAYGISAGFILHDEKFLVISENEIFGRKKRPVSLQKVKSQAIESFVDLNPGDFIVHINYGIGLFKGIKRMTVAGNERDYIALEYAGEETVFIPIEQVNLVQKYIGQGGRKPALDKIGGNAWKKKKGKVSKSVEDIADRLIILYAQRLEEQGLAFEPDGEFQIEFEADFPYEETEDQLKVMKEIKSDMETPHPMDRLVCGDVGFGKTELAMRSAFKCVTSGRQAVYLCPTTILAEQHYENFLERFKRFPVKIGMLSRFVDKSKQKRVLERVAEGEIDILIGTHRLLSADVSYKNLGLFIVDEEQRFGVKHKELLKEMKQSIDCLTLSATPIPRTLYMSLAKIRDLSVLLTPPSNRHPIETFIKPFDEELIAKAIRRELERDGQVFFLHNRIDSLAVMQDLIRRLVPEALTDIAHGQMNSHTLEDIMHRFMNGAFQVLISTTIIENGIDIPNVNTIIIDQADNYGISQLYQLRGRVGRSDRCAYAYLLYPEEKVLSELAMKRLRVISDHTELGAGFKVAMKDLEIRGAGNLVGSEQSGDIFAVGFDMYLQMLEEAIRERTPDQQVDHPPEPLLELEYSGFIPDSYVSSAMEKMELYKKIASITEDGALDALHLEIEDRFGPIPDEVASLFSLSEIKILCKKLWIASLKERGGMAKVIFSRISRISIDKVLRVLKTSGGSVKADSKDPAALLIETGRIPLQAKSEFIKERLSTLI